MFKKLSVLVLLVLFSAICYAQPSQYTPMTAAGYQFKRILTDSTLHLPSFCGVPTLRNSTAKNGALAIDTCNYKLYQWTNGNGWTVVKIDTTSLSNRINLKLNISDTASMLSNYATDAQINNKIDSLKRSSDSIFAYKNNQWVFQYKDSTGGGGITPSLQQVTDVGKTSTNEINLISTYNPEYNTLLNYTDNSSPYGYKYYPFVSFFDSNPTDNSYIKFWDEENYLTIPYEFKLHDISIKPYSIKLGSLQTLLFDNTNIPIDVDSVYMPINDNSNDTLATLNDVRQKLNISDTTNKWVTSVTKINDSTIRVVKNTTTTDITLTPASTVTAATRLVTTVYNNSGSTITKGSVVYINGRHSSNLPTIALAQANTENNSYATFALVQDDILNGNSGVIIQAGNITNLNLPTSSYTDGQVVFLSPSVAGGITTNKTSVLAPNHIVKIGTITRAHPTAGSIEIKIENGWQLDELSDVQIPTTPNDSTLLQFSRVDSLWHSVSVNNAIGSNYIKPSDTTSLSNRINLKVNISDTSNMLSNYLRKSDTTTLSNRINLKVNISDTSNMLSNYLRKSDTTTLSNRINLKVNISDTSNMLSKYLRKSDTTTLSNRINLKVNISDTSSMLTNYLRKIDTTNKFVNNITRTVGKDSIIFYIGSTRYAIKDSTGGGAAAAGSTGYVQFNNAGAFGADAGLFWDNTNKRLGIGTTTPSDPLNVKGTGTGAAGRTWATIENTQTGSASGLKLKNGDGRTAAFQYSGSTYAVPETFSIYTENDFPIVFNTNGNAASGGTSYISFSPGGYNNESVRYFASKNVAIGTTTDAGYKLDVNGTARVQGALTCTAGGSYNGQVNFNGGYFTTNIVSHGTQMLAGTNTTIATYYRTTNGGSNLTPIFAMDKSSGVAGQYTFGLDVTNGFVLGAYNSAFLPIARAGINVTNLTNTAGSESADLVFKTQSGGTAMSEKMRITSGGGITYTATNTAAGTTGNQTINKPSGTVNIAAAGTSITVTNSLVTASSIVFATIRTNDATAVIKNVVPGAGSFTINLNAAATAETSIGFFVIN